MKSVNSRLLCLILGIAVILCVCSIGVLADTSMMSPEDGMISDRGTDHALTPEAGTVQGGDGTSILEGASGALDSVSDFVSDVMDGTDSTITPTTDTSVANNTTGSAAAAVIIFIIIAIAVVALVLVLVPRRR